MPDAAQTPELALRYLDELSTDIRASLVLDAGGQVAAARDLEEQSSERAGRLVVELFDQAGDGAHQVEVVSAEGAVFAVREHGWTIAAVTGRFALPSLIFYDLRSVLGDLGRKAA